MYCRKCGTENEVDAAFCKKCGDTLMQGDDPAMVKRGLSSDVDGKTIFSITPTLKFVKAGYLLAIFASLFVVIFFGIFFPSVSYLFVIPAGPLFLLVPAYFHLRQKLTRYTLTATTIEIDRGLISRTTQNIPLRRVQDVTVTTTMFQRMLGYGDITIDNASEDGTKLVLDNIDSPSKYADQILERMRLLDS